MQPPVNDTTADLWQRAQHFLATNQSVDAQKALLALIEQAPEHVRAHLLLGALAYADGRLRDAARHSLDAGRLPLKDISTLHNAVMALLRTGEVELARGKMNDPLLQRCDDGSMIARFANAQQMIGNHREALKLLDRAIALGIDSADIRYLRSIQLMFNGRTDEAKTELEKCLRAGVRYGRASVTLARLHKQSAENNHLVFIREQLRHVARGSEDHAAFEFAQYKELEDIGDYQEAWRALERGNRIMYSRLNHDPRRENRLLEQLIAKTTSTDIEAQAAAPGPHPIFVIGMPRSGTTLLDRILGNHSMVTPAGELGDYARQLRWSADHVSDLAIDETMLAKLAELDLAETGRRYLHQTQWRSPDTSYFTDKLPANYLWAGLIARSLPDARILHLVRDPMDVCFSNYRAFFGGGYAYSYDLDALAQHYLGYRKIMRHWHATMPGRILDVRYDGLTHEPDKTIREVFSFCGLPYEPGCIDLGRNQTAVATLSAMQVRDGIRQDSFNQWRHYGQQLSALNERIALSPD